jgi:hypothetical protein
MAIRPKLFLHEEILLLALRDEKGTIDTGSVYAYAVGGAVLAELLVRRRVELVANGRKRLVQAIDTKPVGDPLLDECLRRIGDARRRGTATTWVSRFAGTRGLRDRLADGLCRRGILRAEEKEVLLFFKRKTYPAVNPEPEREVVQRLEAAIFTESDVDARTIVLLSLANAARLLPMAFEKRALKERRDRIKALVEQESLGNAVKSAIEAAEAAMVLIATG